MFIKIIKNILSIIKYILLVGFYCMSPDKYDGITFDDWIKKQ